jgi:hypothetical protein
VTAVPLAAILPLLLAQPGASVPRTLAVAPGSTLSYRLVHKLHGVEGVSRAVEGRARILPDGGVQVAVRARVDSFDSGNGNRDAHMREVTEEARFPLVSLKAVAPGAAPPADRAELDVLLDGELFFHGVARRIEIAAKVRFESAGRATVEASFPVSLTAHGVERPSLLFVKVEDRIEVVARLVLEEEGA